MKKILFLLCILIILSLNASADDKITVHVEKGWNMIYGLAFPQEQLISGLSSEDIKVIYAYLPPLREFVRLFPDPELKKLRTIDDDELLNMAFWVYSDRSNNIEYLIYDNSYIPWNERRLYSGWNFVGLTSEVKNKKLGEIAGSCNIKKLAYWQHQQWTLITPDTISQVNHPDTPDDFDDIVMVDSDISIGMGSFFFVTQNCQLGLSEVDYQTPPPIPDNALTND